MHVQFFSSRGLDAAPRGHLSDHSAQTLRIVYNSATGQLFFDANGNAAGSTTLFANLSTGLALSNTDFAVV